MHDVVGIMTGAVVHDLEHPDQEPGETGEPPRRDAEAEGGGDGEQPGATQAP